MTTRNQVLSLFGASPEQIMAKQAQEQARMVQQIQNPYQQTGMAIGTMLGRALGGESPEVTRQRELYSMLEGIDFQDMQPAQLREAAASLASQFPDRALQLLSMADQYETREQQRATSAAQQAQAEAAVETVSVPIYRAVRKTDPNTLETSISYVPETITVGAEEAQFYRDRFRQQTEQMGIQGSGAGTTTPQSTNAKGTFVGSRYIDGQRVDVYEKDGETTGYIGDEIYLPVEPEETQSNQPQTRKQRRSSQTTPSASVTLPASSRTRRGGQMGRNR